MVNTGFIMSTATSDVREGEKFQKRIQILTNEDCNLLFERYQSRYVDKTENKISGMLYRTFSEMDLGQLTQISQAVEKRMKIDYIDI